MTKCDKVSSGQELSSRRGKRRVFLFGGLSLPSQSLQNDLWELDTSAVDFENSMYELPGALWTQLTIKGAVY
jgi:hypothetical protein